jgi:hypothetical protein
MRRRWVAAGVGLAVVGVGVAIAVQQLTRTDHRTTVRPVDELLDEFRDGTDVEGGSDVLPEPGVYVYRTSGFDTADALGGAEHAYPSSTTITVRADGCGVTTRWDVAVERWDETTACSTDTGIARRAFVAFHQFFGVDDTDHDRCTGDPRPLGVEQGTTWTFQCVQDEDESVTQWSGTVLGADVVTVGETPVPAEHVVLMTSGDPDDPRDNDMRIETWYAAGTDLIVREVGSRRTTDPSPIGDVHYEEQYEIGLTALEPLR